MKKVLINFTIIGRILYFANPIVQRFGFSGSVKEIINKLGSKLSVKFESRNTQSCLKNKPVILISNHPFMFGIIALIAAIPQRSDSHLIINSEYFNVYPNLDKFLIPVYIRHQNDGNWYEKILTILFDKVFFYPSYTTNEEHQKNIRSIDYAGSKIKKGGLVIIFPENRDSRLEWYKGVGFLLKGVGKEVKHSVIFACIREGSRRLDYFRLIPFVSRFLPPILINFSKPLTLSKILSEYKDPKKTSRILQHEYKVWSKSLA